MSIVAVFCREALVVLLVCVAFFHLHSIAYALRIGGIHPQMPGDARFARRRHGKNWRRLPLGRYRESKRRRRKVPSKSRSSSQTAGGGAHRSTPPAKALYNDFATGIPLNESYLRIFPTHRSPIREKVIESVLVVDTSSNLATHRLTRIGEPFTLKRIPKCLTLSVDIREEHKEVVSLVEFREGTRGIRQDSTQPYSLSPSMDQCSADDGICVCAPFPMTAGLHLFQIRVFGSRRRVIDEIDVLINKVPNENFIAMNTKRDHLMPLILGNSSSARFSAQAILVETMDGSWGAALSDLGSIQRADGHGMLRMVAVFNQKARIAEPDAKRFLFSINDIPHASSLNFPTDNDVAPICARQEFVCLFVSWMPSHAPPFFARLRFQYFERKGVYSSISAVLNVERTPELPCPDV